MAKVGARQRLQCIGITEAQIKKLVRLEFPKLKTGTFKVTSCPDNRTSKLGKFADISHRLIGVENDEYGKKEVTMKRKKPT